MRVIYNAPGVVTKLFQIKWHYHLYPIFLLYSFYSLIETSESWQIFVILYLILTSVRCNLNIDTNCIASLSTEARPLHVATMYAISLKMTSGIVQMTDISNRALKLLTCHPNHTFLFTKKSALNLNCNNIIYIFKIITVHYLIYHFHHFILLKKKKNLLMGRRWWQAHRPDTARDSESRVFF